MKQLVLLLSAVFLFGLSSFSQKKKKGPLDQYTGKSVVLVFSDEDSNEDAIQQYELLQDVSSQMDERNAVLLSITDYFVSQGTSRKGDSRMAKALRKQFYTGKGFAIAVIGPDGQRKMLNEYVTQPIQILSIIDKASTK